MAWRSVLGARRDSDGRITAVCNPYEQWSPRATGEVIGDILGGEHTYVVDTTAGGVSWPSQQATIRVVRGPSGRYLRTTADRAEVNNLDFLPPCSTLAREMVPRVRRNVAMLSTEERSAFVAAILEVRRRFPRVGSVTDRVNWWFKQDQIHSATHIHTQPSFLPWHRDITNRYEALLQEVDPSLALHYWDWTTDPRRIRGDSGALVDVMTPDFMGAAIGAIGEPFTSLYDPSADPQRDGGGADRFVYPPRAVRRMLPSSGRSPREVTVDDLDWASTPSGTPPPSSTDVTVHDDREVVQEGFDGSEREQFERLWRSLSRAHGWAHSYIGGTLADPHYSFRDPLVFLLHSNVDRLWASWQLRQSGFNHRRAASWRLDPGRTYGGLPDGEIAVPDLDRPLAPQQDEARRELSETFRPWDGRSGLLPWSQQPEPRNAKDPGIVRPPLYDRYVWDEELCCSWPALRMGKRLPAHDIIRAVIEVDAVGDDQVEFVLRAGREVSWWKGLTIPAGDGSDVEISTENDRRRDQATVPRSALAGRELVFSKAIRWWLFLTPHWMMYRLGDIAWLPPGCRVVFIWEDD